jgi:hypothetical protein
MDLTSFFVLWTVCNLTAQQFDFSTLIFESQDHAQVLKDGDDFKKGLAAYTKLKSRFSDHFNDFEEQQHKIIQVALSDFITVISPDNVHDVLRLVLIFLKMSPPATVLCQALPMFPRYSIARQLCIHMC